MIKKVNSTKRSNEEGKRKPQRRSKGSIRRRGDARKRRDANGAYSRRCVGSLHTVVDWSSLVRKGKWRRKKEKKGGRHGTAGTRGFIRDEEKDIFI